MRGLAAIVLVVASVVGRENRREGGKTGDVCLDGGNYRKIAFRTPLIRQNQRRLAIGENNAPEKGMILYNPTDCEDHMGNVRSDNFRIISPSDFRVLT